MFYNGKMYQYIFILTFKVDNWTEKRLQILLNAFKKKSEVSIIKRIHENQFSKNEVFHTSIFSPKCSTYFETFVEF